MPDLAQRRLSTVGLSIGLLEGIDYVIIVESQYRAQTRQHMRRKIPSVLLRGALRTNVVLLLIAIMRLGCRELDERNIVELGRITSPDAVVDAVIAEDRGGGAVGRVSELVYIVPTGGKVKDWNAYQFYASKVESLSVHWARPGMLEVHYRKARINTFRNIWYSRDVSNFHYVEELELIKVGGEKMEFRDT